MDRQRIQSLQPPELDRREEDVAQVAEATRGRSFISSPVEPPSSVTQTTERVSGKISFRPLNGRRCQVSRRLSPPMIFDSPVPPPKTTTFVSSTE